MFTIDSEETLNHVMQDRSYPLVVLDIYADWCTPCKLIAPRLDELSTQYPNVRFCKLNVESNLKPNISNLPTIEFWQIKGDVRHLLQSVEGAWAD